MNNTITEMNTTLEGINSRITEGEERISDLEDKIVEITTPEQNKEKNEDSLRDFWTTLNAPTFKLQGSQKKKRKAKGLRKYFKRLQL